LSLQIESVTHPAFITNERLGLNGEACKCARAGGSRSVRIRQEATFLSRKGDQVHEAARPACWLQASDREAVSESVDVIL
jgi:hypothetical protein